MSFYSTLPIPFEKLVKLSIISIIIIVVLAFLAIYYTGINVKITFPTSEETYIANNSPIVISGRAFGFSVRKITCFNTATGKEMQCSCIARKWICRDVELGEGDNLIKVIAKKRFGKNKEANDQITIRYIPESQN